MKMKVSEAIVKCLQLEGVTTVFGYPGGAVLPLYEALRESDINHILVRQEQSAAHMASGYGRASDTVGVCIATSGPGATNLITGIATAYMDSIPLVAITGQVLSEKIGTDMFQEADVIGATEPFTKHNYLVTNAEDFPRIFKEAFYIANTGRKGPVLIDIPKDIQNTVIKFEYPKSVDIRGYKPTLQGNSRQIERAVSIINKSQKPLICIGGGISSSDCRKELYDFVEKSRIPVICTLMGVDGFPNDSEYFAGLLGSHGYPFVNKALNKADLIVVIGARFADRSTAKYDERRKQSIIHVDIDPAEIGKNVKTNTPIVGDAKNVLIELCKYEYIQNDPSWLKMIQEEREQHMENVLSKEWNFDGANPCKIIKKISDVYGPETIMTSDVGQNQIWAAHYFSAGNKRKYLTSGGLGTMGYSLPAGIGAKISVGEKKPVVAVMGEGGLQMLMSELAIVKENELDLAIVVLTNNSLGMVRELQYDTYGKDKFSGTHLGFTPNLMKLAEAYEIKGYEINSDNDIDRVINDAVKHKGPKIISCKIHPNFPTLLHGGAYNEH